LQKPSGEIAINFRNAPPRSEIAAVPANFKSDTKPQASVPKSAGSGFSFEKIGIHTRVGVRLERRPET
jgi:hypothetical protein